MTVVTVLVAVALGMPAAALAADENGDAATNALLARILRRDYEDGGYTVVEPMTTIMRLKPRDSEGWEKFRNYIRKQFEAQGHDVTRLLDQLITINATPIRLTLQSSPNDGYVIDYDGTFAHYFDKDGGGWKRWYEEHPKAHGLTHVSIPVYDKSAGLILVYTGTQEHWTGGMGVLILYSVRGGRLEELSQIMVWIS